jgi:transcriptional antiterminator NusG
MDEMKWYVIRCSSGYEKKAKKYIEDKLSRQELFNKDVSQILIPTKKEVYVKGGKKVTREVSFYPGYILIETNLSPEVIHIIKSGPGVLNILGSKDKPEPLKEEEVRRFLGKLDELKEKINSNTMNYNIGESVIITEGPFNGFNAIIEEINSDKKKLKVGIKIFGRRTPLEIEYNQVVRP